AAPTKHDGRSPPAGLPAPDRGVSAESKERGPGPPTGRGPDSPLDPGPWGAGSRVDPDGAARASPEGTSGRPRWPHGPEYPPTARAVPDASRESDPRAPTRRPPRDRDPGRRRLGASEAPRGLRVAYLHRTD